MTEPNLKIGYLIYDLDGTLVDSALDFDLMRREIGLPDGAPILEALGGLEADAARRGWEIVERHELRGAEGAVPFAGAAEFLAAMAAAGIRQAVLTRNSRRVAETMLRRLGFDFEIVVTRDEGPIKPDPQAIWRICETWGALPSQTAMIGDSRFDMETGSRAGIRNVLFAAGRDVTQLPHAAWAHYVLHSFHDRDEFFSWLGGQK